MKKKILLIASALLILCGAQILTTQASTTCIPGYSGGTGICTTASSTVGQSLVVSSTDANGYVTWKLAAGGGGGSSTILYQGYAITLTPNPINTTGTVAVNTSTLTSYIATLGYLTSASGTADFYPLSGNPSSFLTSATGVTTFNGSSGAVTGVATNTGNWNGTWKLYSPTDFLSSSTVYVATTSGNWAGTVQGYTLGTIVTHGSGDYYLSTNPSGFISTSTGLTTANFASPNISQWTNNSGYLSSTTGASYFAPSSTVSFTGVTADSPLSGSGTSGSHLIFTNPGYVTSSTGLTYFFPATTTVFYPNSNPSNFISTDQYWTGTSTNLVAATGRTSLGLGTLATQNVPSAGIMQSNGTTVSYYAIPLAAAQGGTATTTALGSNAFTSTAIPTTYVSTFNGNSLAVIYNVAAGTGISVSTSTSLGTITNTGVTSFNGSTGAVTANIPALATTTKSLFDAAPSTSTPDIMFYTETGFTIKQFDCVNSHVAGNSVYVNIGVSSTVNVSTGTLMTTPFLCNSTSTIQSTTTFANATIPANSIIQAFFSGTPSSTGLYLDFKY